MIDNSSLAGAVSRLSNRFTAELLVAGDPHYEEVRRVHNGLIDKRPALIARCHGVADVVDAVKLSRELNLEAAVRGGGHNPAGRATVDGGLMIDLSPMKGIHVNPRGRTVRAQGGVTWAEFNRETQLHGLATTGGAVSSTGISGLTLGGGLGWLMGKYGLTIDNLLSVEMVTADGRVLTASAEENPDLFWGVRGGGGNFGVAASFEYRLHAVGPLITGGLVAHPFEKAGDLLRLYREVTASPHDELTVYAGLMHGPDGSKLAAIIVCYCGGPANGEAATQCIKTFGSPVMDTLGPMTYCDQNTMMDAEYPKGTLNYWKSSFLADLSDDAIRTMTDCYLRCPAPMSGVFLEHVHGAVTRVRVQETAFPHRGEGHDFTLLAQWIDPTDNTRCVSWARETYAAMRPYFAKGRYVNYLDHDEAGDSVAAAYGPNYARLRELKTKYDPDNWFHLNQNIQPVR